MRANKFVLQDNLFYEGMYCLGNGFMHNRASLEEGLSEDYQGEEYFRLPANVTVEKIPTKKSKYGTYIPGIIGKHPLLGEEMINIPFFCGFSISCGDEKLDMEFSEISNYYRKLDIKKGVLTRRVTWHTNSKYIIDIVFERFLSLNNENICAQRINISCKNGNPIISFKSGIDSEVRTNGFNHFKKITTEIMDSFIKMNVLTDNDDIINICSCIKSNKEIPLKARKENNNIFYESIFQLDETIDIYKYTLVTTSKDCNLSSFDFSAIDYHTEKEQHCKLWKKRWQQADIIIEGSKNLQNKVRWAIYHLLRCGNVNDEVSICAKGFSGDAYFGRFFWDSEIFLLPFYLATNPQQAKSLLKYRYNTLSGACANAKKYGYEGAKFAWESSVSGLEQCPSFQYADHEIHITGDIIYGLLNYYKWTRDEEFLYNEGADLLCATAKYWTQRVDIDINNQIVLNGVMGPDEYLPFTRNNCFTNKMVKFSLSQTLNILRKIKAKDINKYGLLLKKYNISKKDLRFMSEIIEKLPLPFDEEKELYLQCSDWYSFVKLDFKKVWKDKTQKFGACVSQERNYRSIALKQADILEMMRLFTDEFSLIQIENAYNYYEPLTTHDSSLSYSTHSIISSYLGHLKEAYKYFVKTLDLDFSVRKHGAEQGIHIANCGGIWQAIVFGFAGLSIVNDKIKVAPHLPDGIKGLEFNIIYKGDNYHISIRGNQWTLQKR